MPPPIGTWVRRLAPRHTKWHLVESVVADDAVTHCGRRMRDELSPFDTSTVMPLSRMIGQPQLCRRCST